MTNHLYPYNFIEITAAAGVDITRHVPPALRPTLLRLAGLILLAASLPAAAGTARVTDVRLWSGPEGTRLVIELSAPAEYDVFALDDPHRVVVDLANPTTLPASETLPAGQGPVKALRSGPQSGHGLRFVLDVTEALKPNSFVVGPDGTAGHRLVVELPGKPASVIAPATAARTAPTGNEVLAMAAETARASAAAVAPATPQINEPTLSRQPSSPRPAS